METQTSKYKQINLTVLDEVVLAGLIHQSHENSEKNQRVRLSKAFQHLLVCDGFKSYLDLIRKEFSLDELMDKVTSTGRTAVMTENNVKIFGGTRSQQIVTIPNEINVRLEVLAKQVSNILGYKDSLFHNHLVEFLIEYMVMGIAFMREGCVTVQRNKNEAEKEGSLVLRISLDATRSEVFKQLEEWFPSKEAKLKANKTFWKQVRAYNYFLDALKLDANQRRLMGSRYPEEIASKILKNDGIIFAGGTVNNAVNSIRNMQKCMNKIDLF